MDLVMIQYLNRMGFEITLAEMKLELKNKISHRAKAFQQT